MTFGSAKPTTLWKLSAERMGIDYRFGSRGFEGIGFNMGFPF